MIGAKSTLISRMLWAIRAGLQFRGARDLYEVYGYPRVVPEILMYEKFRRQDVATTIVCKPAEAIWTDPPILAADPAFVSAWNTFVANTDLWKHFLRADILLGMEQYVAIFLGLPGDSSTPAGTNNKNVAYIQVYGGTNAQITDYFKDPQQANFGSPKTYQLCISEILLNKTISANIVADESRVIHLTNELLDANTLSYPRLLKGFNLLEDLLKITGGSAETFWLVSNRGMQVDIDKDMELDQEDAQALADEIDEYQHELRRVIRTRGVKVNNLGANITDPTGAFKLNMALLAATYKIPQRMLLGAEVGQLASEQDRANWAAAVAERRATFAVPYFLMPTIRKAQLLGLLPIEKEEITFIWPSAFKLSPLEKAQTMAQKARAIVNMSRQTQFGLPIATTEECREIIELPDAPLQHESSGLPTVEDSMTWIRRENSAKNAQITGNNAKSQHK